VLRYRPLARVIVVADQDDADIRVLATLAAGVCGVPLTIVTTEEEALSALDDVNQPWATRIRAPRGASDAVLTAAHSRGVVVDPSPLVGDGGAELPHWLLEQAVSRTLHRYGRLLRRSA
jgi:RHH-type proline utilization regulon transcriptional repressor/proline dehydrogenase/delta 1-pyrroline-5-carboxylate dehydrogenase